MKTAGLSLLSDYGLGALGLSAFAHILDASSVGIWLSSSRQTLCLLCRTDRALKHI